MGIGDREAAAVGVRASCHQRGLAHELLDERRRDALGPGDHCVGVDQPQGDAGPVEIQQAPPRLGIGQRDLDCLVDPSGPRGERRLERVRPVRGQQEDQVRILVEAVHDVEQREQQRRHPVVGHPLAGDEVLVLQDTSAGWSARARVAAASMYWKAAPLSSTTVWSESRPIRYRVVSVLPVPGGPCRSRPALEVLPGDPEPLAVRGDPEYVLLDRSERRLRKDHVLAGELRSRMESERSGGLLAEWTRDEADDLVAKDVRSSDSRRISATIGAA